MNVQWNNTICLLRLSYVLMNRVQSAPMKKQRELVVQEAIDVFIKAKDFLKE